MQYVCPKQIIKVESATVTAPFAIAGQVNWIAISPTSGVRTLKLQYSPDTGENLATGTTWLDTGIQATTSTTEYTHFKPSELAPVIPLCIRGGIFRITLSAADSCTIRIFASNGAIAGGGGSGGGDASAANQVTEIARLTEIRDKIISAPATEAKQDTQITRLTEIRDKIISAPATEVKQDTQITRLAEIRDKIIASPATEAKQDTQITRLTEIRDKIISAPATEAKQDTIIARLAPAYTVTADNHTANQAVVKASAGKLYALFCNNASSTVGYFQIHNKATAPVNGDVPIKSVLVPANSAVGIGIELFGAGGVDCSTGVAWAWSSTRATLTLATGSDKTSWVGFL